MSGSKSHPSRLATSRGALYPLENSKHGGAAMIRVGGPNSSMTAPELCRYHLTSNIHVCGTWASFSLFSTRMTLQWGEFANASDAPPRPEHKSSTQLIGHATPFACLPTPRGQFSWQLDSVYDLLCCVNQLIPIHFRSILSYLHSHVCEYHQFLSLDSSIPCSEGMFPMLHDR